MGAVCTEHFTCFVFLHFLLSFFSLNSLQRAFLEAARNYSVGHWYHLPPFPIKTPIGLKSKQSRVHLLCYTCLIANSDFEHIFRLQYLTSAHNHIILMQSFRKPTSFPSDTSMIRTWSLEYKLFLWSEVTYLYPWFDDCFSIQSMIGYHIT